MKRILLTGGRAPVTLELARLFQAAGHTVFVAESVPWHVCRGSRAVAQNFRVPPPNRQPQQFIEALAEIVRREKIDLLIPTCEETLFVAAGLALLNPFCTVFADNIAVLKSLHNKYTFVQQARQLGLPTPDTQIITTPEQVYPHLPDSNFVLKPIYSRFGTHTVILPRHTTDVPKSVSPATPWVMQEFMPGQQLCTYSIAHAGRLAAHSTYAVEYTAGHSTIAFEPLRHPAAFEWVQHFVAQTHFTGQIAFDFIEANPGRVLAIECNPRTTSGIHLFDNPQNVAQAFLGDPPKMVMPHPHKKAMLALPMLVYGLPKVRSRAALRHWAATFFSSRDVIFNRHDPLPGLFWQWASLAWFGRQSFKHRVSLPAATTLDIEWNSTEKAVIGNCTGHALRITHHISRIAKVSSQMKLTLLQTGYCTAHEAVMLRGGRWKSVAVPALVAVIEHPRLGPILFDTGYSPRFFRDTRRWPYNLYAKMTPVIVSENDTAAAQLQAIGVNPADVRHLIISHFHADHIGGLADFPNARYIFFKEAYESVRGKQGWGAVKLAFLPDHLPSNFERRSTPIEATQMQPLSADYAPFEQGVDLFGDGSFWGVSLPGHAHGQMGVFLQTSNLGPVFLCADACWHSKAYRELVFPHPIVNLLLPDAAAYRQTLTNIHQLHQNRPNLQIIPSHCLETMNNYQLAKPAQRTHRPARHDAGGASVNK